MRCVTLACYCTDHDAEIFQMLLAHGANTEARDENKIRPSHLRVLLEHGSDGEARCEGGKTALLPLDIHV